MSGFFESMLSARSAPLGGKVGSRLGAVPLEGGDSELLFSAAHSRLSADSTFDFGPGRISAYAESDFLDARPEKHFRFRQLYARYDIGRWEISGGKEWSLLRPNRMGLSSRQDLMNTQVPDPSYHVGLMGVRNRQIRVAHHGRQWHAGLAFEQRGDVVPKLAHDGRKVHWELIGLAGRRGHLGFGGAAVWRATDRLHLVTQQFVARHGGREALSTVDSDSRVTASIGGVEYKLLKNWMFYGYGGAAAASRSRGNRMATQWTGGLSRTIFQDRFGQVAANIQFSRLGRETWAGRHGEMNLLLISLRHTFALAR